jgi:succinylglutamic semialdehyde dehydrogenase
MSADGVCWIDGHARPGTGEPFASLDPAEGSVVWRGNAASKADVDAACRCARRAYPTWENTSLEHRAEHLRAFARVLETSTAPLAETISRETGKPLWESRTELQSMVAKIEISIAAHAARCSPFTGGAAITRFRAHGVVAVLGPFNFPGHLPNGHIVPALLAGNTVLFKPSERAPAVAELTVRLWHDAGLPRGVLQLLHGGRDTAQELVRHEEIDGVFFTGSARAGLWLHEHFARRPDRILALEMGGNNPLVAWSIHDLDAAALAVVQSAFLSAGQRCTCARRLVIPAGRDGERLLERVVACTAALRVGAWTDRPEPFMGPVVGADAARALVEAQASLVARGATPLLELRSLRADTGRVSPGLLDVSAVADRPDEELFGPLLQVVRVRDFGAALSEARATRYGLAAGLLSDDPALWDRFRREARVGIVNWNQPLTGASSSAPFGGIGLSGNHRPSAWFAADYCSRPVAGIEVATLARPEKLPPGIETPSRS